MILILKEGLIIKNKSRQREIVILLIPIFILTVCWVVFNVYHSYVNSTIKDPLTSQIIPIQGKFDTETISDIKERKRVDPTSEIIVSDEASPTPTLDEDEEASESGDIFQDQEEDQ